MQSGDSSLNVADMKDIVAFHNRRKLQLVSHMRVHVLLLLVFHESVAQSYEQQESLLEVCCALATGISQ